MSMDVAAALKNEFIKPFAALVAPGGVAVTPYALLLLSYVPVIRQLSAEYSLAAAAVFLSAVLCVGFILDDVGQFIEANFWDPMLEAQYPGHTQDWHDYQKLRLRDELIAHRFLRDVLTRMKFELTMAPALLIF